MDDPKTAYETSEETDLGNTRGVVSFREKKPFRKRNGAALEGVEQKCLTNLSKERMQLFRNSKLRSWPHHFDTPEQCGEELQKGLMVLWSSYLVVETLLAAVAIQPLISIQGLASPHYRVFGLLWMLALLCDSMGLAVTAIFLGYLLFLPGKLTWIWVCRLGPLRGLPTLILVSDTLLSLLAMGHTVWTLYGPAIGIPCLFVEVTVISIGAWVYWFIRSLKEEEADDDDEEAAAALQTPQPSLMVV